MTDLLPDGELVDAMAMAERLVAADPERGPRSLLARALIQTHLDVMAEHEARVAASLDETEARLIKAWRRSGMTLGYLLTRALQGTGQAHMVAARASALSDRALVGVVDVYARNHGQGTER